MWTNIHTQNTQIIFKNILPGQIKTAALFRNIKSEFIFILQKHLEHQKPPLDKSVKIFRNKNICSVLFDGFSTVHHGIE
jgi:hypothetical protein